jgi:tryptophan synthase beta chain
MDTRIKSGFFVCAAGLGSSKKRCCSVKVYNDFFGEYGGRYVAEVLRSPLLELETAFCDAMADSTYLADLAAFGKDYVGRPTPLLYAENASAEIGGGRIYIKLEGLANTGAHKVNNVIGQALLAKRMGKTRIIAETGAGQHGLATAAVCAKMGLDCTVYMGEVDIARQRPNVFWMEMFGAKIVPVSSGARTLKDAVNEALRDWSSSFSNTHYLLGSALGPSPYPDMVREFQAVIGRETAAQLTAAGVEAEALVACVGGGSNSIGFFEPYLETDSPRLVGVEAGGTGSGPGRHASRLSGEGRPGIVHGYKSLFLLDDDGQVLPTHSVSAGLDYPGVGPQLAQLGKSGRVEFTTASDSDAIDALSYFARTEGVLFALESAHAGAAGLALARECSPEKAIIINMSGRGDKDLFIAAGILGGDSWSNFLKSEVERCEK